MSGATHTRRWMVAGGGTGGHVTPALALAEKARERGDEVLLLGSERGLEVRLVPEAGFELVALSAQPVYGRGLFAIARSVPAIVRACIQAWRHLGAFRADFVISIGGYASVPAVVAAFVRRVPIALVEPNAIPGRANRAAARFAVLIFVQFDEARTRFEAVGAGDKVRNVGIPLRSGLIEAFSAETARRSPEAPFRLLVCGGSQGARQINDAMIEAAPHLDPESVEIFHQSGEADRERTAAAYRAAGLRAEVVDFEPDMPARYRWADVALCRAGALTIAELTLAGLPALLVPYPFAADDHQSANATALVDAGAARLLAEQPLPGGRVEAELRELFAAPERLMSMSRSALRLAQPDAAHRVIEACAQVGG